MTDPGADNHPRTLLAHLVRERNWTVEDFCWHYTATGRSLPRTNPEDPPHPAYISERQAIRWLGGRLTSRPYPSACRILAAMFGRLVGDLFGPPPLPGAGPRPPESGDDARLTRYTHPDPTRAVTWPQAPGGEPQQRHQEDPTNRRDAIRCAAVAAVGTAAASAPVLSSAERLAALDRTAAADGAVAVAESALRTVVADYLSQPPAAIFARVAAVQRLTDAVQAEYLLRPADTGRLWRVAGIAAGMRGWLENNAGDTDAARGSLREAHRRGVLIGDDQLTAWARYMQAIVEDYAGDTDAAERYALDGLHHTTERSPQRALLLGDMVATICAGKGDQGGTDAALVSAHDIVAALAPEQHGPAAERRMIVDSMATYSPAMFAADAGCAYARLGRPDRFYDVTAGERRAADRAGSGRRVYLRMDEAVAVLRSEEPDPDRAAGLARDGLTLASPFQTAHTTERLRTVFEAAKPFATHPAIVDLTEYSAAWQADLSAHRPTLEI